MTPGRSRAKRQPLEKLLTYAHSVMRTAQAAARRVLPAWLYRLYRQRKVARLVAAYDVRQVTHTYGDVRLTIELPDGLAEGWYDRDWPHLPEIERLRSRGLASGALVFDIGAHQGVVALMLASVVGPEGRVIAVEAEPHNARAATRNRALNEAENLQIIHAAGSDAPGTLLFAEGLTGRVEDYGSPWGKVRVPAVTVDGLASRFGMPDVVVIDVEGFEDRVLAGAAKTIAAAHTTFLVEVHVGHGLECPAERILDVFGPPYRLLVAPAQGENDAFVVHDTGAPVPADRFFLIAELDRRERLSSSVRADARGR